MRVSEKENITALDLTDNLKDVLDTFPGFVWCANPDGSIKYYNKKGLEYTGFGLEEINGWNWQEAGLLHPDEVQSTKEIWMEILKSGKLGEIRSRMRRYDGKYLWFLHYVAPQFDDDGKLVAWWGVDIDIDEKKRAEDKLRKSEVYLAEAQKLTSTGSFSINVSTNELICSEETLSIIGFASGTAPTLEEALSRVHPDDRQIVIEKIDRAIEEGSYLNYENRLLMPDGLVKYVRVVAHLVDFNFGSPEFVGAVSDITQIKLAEKEIRQKEREFRQIVEAVPGLIIVTGSDGEYLYANNNLLDYTGYKQKDVISGNFRELILHPEDLENLSVKRKRALDEGKPFGLEERFLDKNGKYRWFLTRFNPFKDSNDNIVKWYITATDIDDRKRKEEKVQNENIVLREVIDKTSNPDIVGTSKQIQDVYRLISLVAKTNSSVLILGETGTGKELVARAIHNSSDRKDKLMIKVNCAALPANLIESELFGHEKGSFTGATDRRIGKFELANNSTLFLDEIGEMSLELQVKLLRAIQEKEIERVGGRETFKVNVRIIAASNRNLQKEVKDGNFRSDLYYRLHVFPIMVPPLRERKEDIPALANHFLDKSAKNIGKRINGISDEAMNILINYNWPGNVRELEHLIERCVILNDGMIHTIQLPKSEPDGDNDNAVKTLSENERDYIISVLKKCNGKKSGIGGAATLLGMPVSTLNSKMKKLGITKEIYFTKK